MTPLFDTNAHPALAADGSTESFSTLKALLDEAGFRGACAVGLPAKDSFEPRLYFASARAHGFFPVAAWNNTPDAQKQAADLTGLGYRAIKIHPRLSGLSVRDPGFGDALRAAADAGMTVFHCSYQFAADARHAIDPLPALIDAVARVPGLRMILLHGGTVELLRYAEAVRASRNLLLDLSFTLNRYEGSSLDHDIGFLFRTFDQRICIGSDYPDYAPAQVRARFEHFAAGLSQEKRDNIGWRNITTLLEIAS
jgi:predicted TIM-barrel fold metal-dependent hydrolase